MKMKRITGLFAVALSALVACGPLQQGDSDVNAVQGALTSLIGGVVADESTPEGQAPELTRALIDAQDAELMRMSIISRDATGLVVLGGTNGTKRTWLSPEGVSFTFDNGFLVGTRGFGDDLMGSDIAGARQSLFGGGNHLRTLDFLNGLSQIERRTYQCQAAQVGRENITIVERTYATSIIEETCTSDMNSFKNTYWRDANGVIWQSRQWISDSIGYLGYQRL